MSATLVLRKIKRSDAFGISEAFRQQGWDKPASQYEQYFEFQESGERDVIVAELYSAQDDLDGLAGKALSIDWPLEGEITPKHLGLGVEGIFAGYLTIKWQSDYAPFRAANIPEIVDFNVLKKFQRLGIGSKLMDEAERRIKRVSKRAGIGFGVYQDYGAAQVLYVKRGYVPDGNGINRNSVPLRHGDVETIDDGLILCLVKDL